jgi:hypothetical protein
VRLNERLNLLKVAFRGGCMKGGVHGALWC